MTKEINKMAPNKKAISKIISRRAKKQTLASYRYHISKRSDGKWQIKRSGGKRALKLFATQKEVMAFANRMAENKGVAVFLHTPRNRINQSNAMAKGRAIDPKSYPVDPSIDPIPYPVGPTKKK